MKILLLKVHYVLLLMAAIYLPGESTAQCLCQDGETPIILEHVVVLDTTTASNSTISFPKFDPAMGTLTCVMLNDTLSILSGTGIRNYDTQPTEYEFSLNVNTQVAGPSLSRVNSKTKTYGPDLLGAFESPTDSINYGPDTIYNNFASAKVNNSNVTPYLGATGTVSFTYTIGGGVIAVGGANYNAKVRTTTWGIFKLTYSWCNNLVLASAIRNFSIMKTGKFISFKWKGPEGGTNKNYKIQISYDGTTFSNIEPAGNTAITESAAAEYQYQYQPYQPVNGKLYFRVRYDNEQKVIYSPVRNIDFTDTYQQALKIYPNPVIKQINLDFPELMNGEFSIELANQVGQVVYRRKVWINQSHSVQIPVQEAPAPGVYFMKARQTGSAKVYTGKLLFRR